MKETSANRPQRSRAVIRAALSQVGRSLKMAAGAVVAIAPTTDDERTFLRYQVELREGGARLLNEAMLVLDIIDAKSEALLAYVSISVAAMLVLLTALPNSANLRVAFLTGSRLTTILLAVILALSVAVILLLSCLNIVGAHTVRGQRRLTQQEYEDLIVRVTLGRRMRYLIAQRISIATAVVLAVLFAGLLVGSVTRGADTTESGPGPMELNLPL